MEGIGLSRKIRRLLGRLLVLTSILIILHSPLITKWMYSESNQNDEQNLQNVDQIPNSRLPWYFKDGRKRPNKSPVNLTTGFRNREIWPKEQNNGDRIEEQLMFVPSNYEYENATMKKILLFNNFMYWMVNEEHREFLLNKCPVNKCTIIAESNEFSDVDAVLFRDHFSHPGHKKTDKQVWILYLLHSPYHTPELTDDKNEIDWIASYRHDSEIVVPYNRWAYYDPLVTQIERVNWNFARGKTKQVVWFVSNCFANNGRLEYARELAKHISVDVYGACGHFHCTGSNCFQMLNSEYKFFLAFEHSNCIDYVTEKFFTNGLQYGALPIVMGGRREDYERIAPKRSFVHVDDFESPEMLAKYLRRLDENDSLYNEYFRWIGTGEFIDTRFFCRLCAMLHDDRGGPAKRGHRKLNDWWHDPGACTNTEPWRKFVESEPRVTDYRVGRRRPESTGSRRRRNKSRRKKLNNIIDQPTDK